MNIGLIEIGLLSVVACSSLNFSRFVLFVCFIFSCTVLVVLFLLCFGKT